VPVELGAGPTAKLVVAPVLAAHGYQPEAVTDMSAASKRREPRQEIARGQIAGRPEENEALDHRDAPFARASVTPLAITPMWLNAWGKFPVSSPLDGSICSDNSPSGLALAHSDS
jgi:hypothetical protein